jgi:hypothetical protein
MRVHDVEALALGSRRKQAALQDNGRRTLLPLEARLAPVHCSIIRLLCEIRAQFPAVAENLDLSVRYLEEHRRGTEVVTESIA